MVRSDNVVAWSETADESRMIKSAKETSKTKSKIVDMINARTGGPSLTDLKEGLKLQNLQVARKDLTKFKARIGAETKEDEERAIRPRVNRVYNSIN